MEESQQFLTISEYEKDLKSFIEQTLNQTFILEQLNELVENINSADLFKQHYGVIGIRKVLSVDVPPVQPIIDANLIPRLIQFMKTEQHPHLQFEAAWALTNVASGTADQLQVIIDEGGIPLFISLLSSKHQEIVEQTIWAIGNIAAEGPVQRDLILDCDMIDQLSEIVQTSIKQSVIKQGTWALSNLCRGNPLPNYSKVYKALPAFCQVIINEQEKQIIDKEIIADATWALSHLSAGDSDRIQILIDTGIIPSLIQNLRLFILLFLYFEQLAILICSNSNYSNYQKYFSWKQ